MSISTIILIALIIIVALMAFMEFASRYEQKMIEEMERDKIIDDQIKDLEGKIRERYRQR
jgi:hypothetical protein